MTTPIDAAAERLAAEEIKPCPYVNGFSSDNKDVSFTLKTYPLYYDFILFEEGKPSRCFRFYSSAHRLLPALQAENAELRRDLEQITHALYGEAAKLQARVKELEDSLCAMKEVARDGTAEVFSLQREIERLRGALEELLTVAGVDNWESVATIRRAEQALRRDGKEGE